MFVVLLAFVTCKFCGHPRRRIHLQDIVSYLALFCFTIFFNNVLRLGGVVCSHIVDGVWGGSKGTDCAVGVEVCI